jgi:hypothetical protein
MIRRFEDTKGVIRIGKSKDRQHNGQKKKYKRTNNITHKTKDRVTQTPRKTGGSCSINGTHTITLVTNTVISHE